MKRMTPSADANSVATPADGGIGPALMAVRTRFGLVLLLWIIAAACWVWSVREMSGMDMGPWTMLGPAAWFLAVWIVMMAAMMLPSVAPTIALYARMTRKRSPVLPILFAGGYLLVWAGAGAVFYLLAMGIQGAAGDHLAWEHMGRQLAGIVLIVAAVYQLSPIKHVCLEKCRNPLAQLFGSWRDGPLGAVNMGIRNGAWCLGCCWMLMTALFALGIMSIAWMALMAGIIAVEKLWPQRRVAVYGTAGLLLVLGTLMLTSPEFIPGLTVPGESMPMEMPMGSKMGM